MPGNFNNEKVEIQWGNMVVLGPKRRDGAANRTLSNMGLLSKFIGMLTDSRSFYLFQGMNILDGCYAI